MSIAIGHSFSCNYRFRADILNTYYEENLKKIKLRPEAHELFDLVLEDENIFTCKREYANERKKILNTISKEELHIAKARRYFVDEKIDFADFSKLKKSIMRN